MIEAINKEYKPRKLNPTLDGVPTKDLHMVADMIHDQSFATGGKPPLNSAWFEPRKTSLGAYKHDVFPVIKPKHTWNSNETEKWLKDYARLEEGEL